MDGAFTINSDGDITAVRTETNSDPTARAFSFTYGSDGSYPSMVQVDSDTYAVAHTGPNSDGFIRHLTFALMALQ